MSGSIVSAISSGRASQQLLSPELQCHNEARQGRNREAQPKKKKNLGREFAESERSCFVPRESAMGFRCHLMSVEAETLWATR